MLMAKGERSGWLARRIVEGERERREHWATTGRGPVGFFWTGSGVGRTGYKCKTSLVEPTLSNSQRLADREQRRRLADGSSQSSQFKLAEAAREGGARGMRLTGQRCQNRHNDPVFGSHGEMRWKQARHGWAGGGDDGG